MATVMAPRDGERLAGSVEGQRSLTLKRVTENDSSSSGVWFVTITTGMPAVLAPAGKMMVPVAAIKSLGDLAMDRRKGRTCEGDRHLF